MGITGEHSSVEQPAKIVITGGKSQRTIVGAMTLVDTEEADTEEWLLSSFDSKPPSSIAATSASL